LIMTLPSTPPAPTRLPIHAFTPERTAGGVPRYDHFADFRAELVREAASPDQIGIADLVDVINPLQHLPLIGHVYRELTGDTIKPAARLAGGAAFGGPLGLLGAGVMVTMLDQEPNKPTAPTPLETKLAAAQPTLPTDAPPTITIAWFDQTAPTAGTFLATAPTPDRGQATAPTPQAPQRVSFFSADRTAGGVVRYEI
jgi:hypothetical protein